MKLESKLNCDTEYFVVFNWSIIKFRINDIHINYKAKEIIYEVDMQTNGTDIEDLELNEDDYYEYFTTIEQAASKLGKIMHFELNHEVN